jgi:DNA-binding MarR family transcriptional regulator
MAKKYKDIIKKEQMLMINNIISGEVENAKVTVIVSRETAKYKNESFTLLFQASTRAISRHIKPITAKMLIHLCAIVEYENFIPQGKTEMANELGYSIRQVERALNDLEEMKVIIKSKHPQDYRSSIYHLNPFQSWKGKPNERAKKISSYDKFQLEMFPNEDKIKAIQPSAEF